MHTRSTTFGRTLLLAAGAWLTLGLGCGSSEQPATAADNDAGGANEGGGPPTGKAPSGDPNSGDGYDYRIIGVAVTPSGYAASDVFCAEGTCRFVGHGYHVQAECGKTCHAYLHAVTASMHYDGGKSGELSVEGVDLTVCDNVEALDGSYPIEARNVSTFGWNAYLDDERIGPSLQIVNSVKMSGEHYPVAYGVETHAGYVEVPIARCKEGGGLISVPLFILLGDTPKLREPAAVLRGAKRVETGATQGCAVVESGQVLCWGGSGTPGAAVPVPGVENAVDVMMLIQSNCAVLADGGLSCWPSLDLGKPARRIEGIDDAVGLARYRATPGTQPCIIQRSGSVVCVTLDSEGQKDVVSEPWPALQDVSAAVGTKRDGCALHGDGTVSCWGDNALFAADLPTTTGAPVAIDGIEGAVEIAPIERGMCARLEGGSVLCWGAFQGSARADGPEAPPGVDDVIDLGAYGVVTSSGSVKRLSTKNGSLEAADFYDINEATTVGEKCLTRADGQVWCWSRFPEPEPVPMPLSSKP